MSRSPKDSTIFSISLGHSPPPPFLLPHLHSTSFPLDDTQSHLTGPWPPVCPPAALCGLVSIHLTAASVISLRCKCDHVTLPFPLSPWLSVAFRISFRLLCLAPTFSPSSSLQPHLLPVVSPRNCKLFVFPRTGNAASQFTHLSLCLKCPSFCVTCPPPSAQLQAALPDPQQDVMPLSFVTFSPSARCQPDTLHSVLSQCGAASGSSFFFVSPEPRTILGR